MGGWSLATDKDKVWCKCIQSLSEVAKDDPQASFAALTSWNGIISNELLCIVELCLPLSNMLLILSFFGGAVSEQKITLFSLSTCYGGLGINNCVKSASSAFQSSREDSVLLIDAIVNNGRLCLADHLSHLDAVYICVTKKVGISLVCCSPLCCLVFFF